MSSITMKELLEAGVHFGHQTKRWNPKMREYIFGERNGIYIVDLQKTLKLFKEALKFATQLGAEGKKILFIGTKRQAQEVVAEEAQRAGMFYVNERWLGGLLTNYVTIERSIGRLRELNALMEEERFEEMSKKELSRLDKERKRLDKNLRGIMDMGGLPHAVFVIDANREEIAVNEARKLGIPVIAIVDTNCDPDVVDYVIPGNDDALRAIKLFTSRIADAVIAGQEMSKEATPEASAGPEGESGPSEESGEPSSSDEGKQPAAKEASAATTESAEPEKTGDDSSQSSQEDTAPATTPPA